MERLMQGRTQGWAVAVLLTLVACEDSAVVAPAAPPMLTGLSITGATHLTPTFEASVERYSVIATEGDSLRLVLEADPVLSMYVDGVPVESGVSLTVSSGPGRVIDIQVTNSSNDVRRYEIVYLPADFPELEVTTPDGYTPDGVTYVTMENWLAILDENAVPFFFKRHAEGSRVFDFKLHPSGERSYALRSGDVNEFDHTTSVIIVLDESLQESDRVTTVGLNQTDNHDFLIRPNGNYVLLSYHGELRDMTAFGGTVDQLVEESVIQEIDRGRDVLFQWSSWDEVPWTEQLYNPPRSEYAHVNSVFVDGNGDFIVSLRGVSQVVKVDRATGTVEWKLGGMSNDFTYVVDPYMSLCGQHHAQVLSGGHVLLFDNGAQCWPKGTAHDGVTRVAEYALDLSEMTATLVWSYEDPEGFSRAQGSVQRLANGNTLIGWGRTSSTSMATEVEPDGDRVWELQGVVDGEAVTSYRALRYAR
jgi:hypothetical protein